MSDQLRDIIRQIKEQTDIVELVGRVVALKKFGTSFKGLCPFHKEKTPSFNVIPARNMFHCFGCSASGSVIDFVMRTDHLEFMEAVEKAAKDMGVELPQRGSFQRAGASTADKEMRRGLQSANDAALAWFRDNLLKGRNRLASDYLPKRAITPEISEKFQLGAAVDGWTALRDHLAAKGFSDALLVDAGLCVRSERGGRIYDRFRNRLLFPIWDVNGKVSGFGGRQLVDEENSPKYLNSAETELYKKSRMLYGLNIARAAIESAGYAILCEGYMDVIMCHAMGYPQAVASLGTALTIHQAKLLKRFANRTYFLYDGDSAGQKAMLRGGEALLQTGFDTRVMVLPPSEDPDSFLRAGGEGALDNLKENAPEFFDYAMDANTLGLDPSTLAGQAELAERMTPIIAAMQNDVMREGAIARLLGNLGGLPRQALEQIMKRRKMELERQAMWADGREDAPAPSPAAPELNSLERRLLKLIVESQDALEYTRLHLHQYWITDDRIRPWIFYFYDHPGYIQTLLDDLEVAEEQPADRTILHAVLAWDYPIGEDGRSAAEEMLRRMHETHQRGLTRKLIEDLKDLEGEAAERMLKLITIQTRDRMKNAGRFLRTRDYRSRRGI